MAELVVRVIIGNVLGGSGIPISAIVRHTARDAPA
jgi:hypothetical protein